MDIWRPNIIFHTSRWFSLMDPQWAPSFLIDFSLVCSWYCYLVVCDCFPTDLILYIVVCTYKSVVGLGHNSTKPVEPFVPSTEWVRQWRKETRGRWTTHLPFPKRRQRPPTKTHPKQWIQKHLIPTELLISSIPSSRYHFFLQLSDEDFFWKQQFSWFFKSIFPFFQTWSTAYCRAAPHSSNDRWQQKGWPRSTP